MNTAILQHADTGAIESMAVMMHAIGWECALPSNDLKNALRGLRCDTVCDVDTMVRQWGYEPPSFQGKPLPEVGVSDLSRTDVVLMDVKAHRNAEKIWKRWPGLKVIWHRVNGSEPENVPGKGNEIDPPVPVLTPDLWYRERGPWSNRSYAYWPPFYRIDDYVRPRPTISYDPPLCLINNIGGWGHGAMVEPVRKLGVKCYGLDSPEGLVHHSNVPGLLSRALCMLHLKSNDAPGYALYESLAAACPIVCSWRLINRCKMHDLFIPGETCLVFDRDSTDVRGPLDLDESMALLVKALGQLSDPRENVRIGLNGRNRLKEVMWSPDKPADVESLRAFMDKVMQ